MIFNQETIKKLTMMIYICIMFVGFSFGIMFLFLNLIGLGNQWGVMFLELLGGCYGLYYVYKNFPNDGIEEYFKLKEMEAT